MDTECVFFEEPLCYATPQIKILNTYLPTYNCRRYIN